MNQELLKQIQEAYETQDTIKLYENNKINESMVRDIHELYVSGYLHLPKYCRVFGYSRAYSFRKVFKKFNLRCLKSNEMLELYGDMISEKKKQTNLERYGVENPLQLPEIQEKVRKTNLERYGYENHLQSPDIKEKITQTNLERYGCSKPIQNPEIREKWNQTNLEKYGSVSPLGSKEIQEKIHQTNLEKYGSVSPLGSKEIQEKIHQTNLEKYGYENPFSNKDVQDKIKKTNLGRYGCENPFSNKDVQDKIKKTNIERYGHEYSTQSHEIRQKLSQRLKSEEIQDRIKSTNIERYGHEYATQSPKIKERVKQTNIERYGHEYATQSPEIQEKIKSTRKSNDGRYAKLLDLVESNSDKTSRFVIENYPHNHAKILKRYGVYEENLSTPEAAIREILEKNQIEYLFRHRPKFMRGKELDFFIPSKNLAIEVNGLYWHSYPKKDKSYHQDKHLRCRYEGIQLLSFTEDQILEKSEIIESMILHKLGLTPYRVYAKKCTIVEIDHKKAKDFLEKNHLHGFSNASVYLGLEYNGKLVHVMSFGNNRFKRSNHPELIRSASLRFHSVAGGFQRLLKYYKRSHGVNLVESYVDFNISNGQSYELASKDLEDLPVRDNLTEPDLWFVFRGKRYRRQMFMKHNLHKIFSDFPRRSEDGYKDITVREYLKERGVLEYYGAGNLKYLI